MQIKLGSVNLQDFEGRLVEIIKVFAFVVHIRQACRSNKEMCDAFQMVRTAVAMILLRIM